VDYSTICNLYDFQCYIIYVINYINYKEMLIMMSIIGKVIVAGIIISVVWVLDISEDLY
jgi:hypothetical protein